MGKPAYKKQYPYDSKSPEAHEGKNKELTKKYVTKLQELLKDPKMAKKAAKIIEEMLKKPPKS